MSAAATLAAASLLALAGCAGGEEDRTAVDPQPQRPIVLVSGRDDHGLVAESEVGLSRAPDGPEIAHVADGTLVAVVGTRGEWLRVRALEGRPASGWINDYYLRGTLHLSGSGAGCEVPVREQPGGRAAGSLPRNAQVELLAYRRRNATAWVRVRAVADGETAWVERERVSELPDRRSGC